MRVRVRVRVCVSICFCASCMSLYAYVRWCACACANMCVGEYVRVFAHVCYSTFGCNTFVTVDEMGHVIIVTV